MWEQVKKIVKSVDRSNIAFCGEYPKSGEYVITGSQFGNLNGELGWQSYVGYVVQVRKKAGAFGSHMVLLRHPDGLLIPHENQSYYRMDEYWLKKAKALFPDNLSPEQEDYTEPYTLRGGLYPEIGKIIEPQDNGPPVDNSPMMKITVNKKDGSKESHFV